MLTVEFRGVKELVRDLRVARERALPYAVKTAVNSAAFEARTIWQGEIRRSFTTRNRYTERSILVERARGLDAKRMVAVVGSVAPYMGDQETGAVIRGKGKHKAIPGPAAAGLPAGAKRTRMVRAPNKLSAIKVAKVRGSTVQQRWAIALGQARRTGRKFVLLERPKGGKALFRVGGGKRRKATLRLLWDVSRSSVRVPPEPTLQRTLKALEPKLPHMYQAALLEQFRRHKLLGF
jgi:hypothetical protein